MLNTQELQQIAKVINDCDRQLAKAFEDWLEVVGSNLERAKVLHCRQSDNFKTWVERHLPFTLSYAYRIIKCRKYYIQLKLKLPESELPRSLVEIHPLSKLDIDDGVEVWKEHLGSGETIKQLEKRVKDHPGKRSGNWSAKPEKQSATVARENVRKDVDARFPEGISRPANVLLGEYRANHESDKSPAEFIELVRQCFFAKVAFVDPAGETPICA